MGDCSHWCYWFDSLHYFQVPMNYLCFVDGLLEYASSDPSSFAHYQLVYAEEHQNANVQYFTLTDEEYDEMFPYEEDE